MRKKVLYGFGDSLVEGHCIGIGMLDALARKHGLHYEKYARNGASVIPMEGRPSMIAQIEGAANTAPDLICFNGLTNDAYHATPRQLGCLSESCAGGYDTATFYGAFQQICYLLRRKYLDSPIFFVASHRMPGVDMAFQEMLQEAARKACAKWSIPVIDVFRRGQINTCVEEMREKYSYDTADCLTGGNGTHLNAAGYEKWYLPMIEAAVGPYIQ